MAGWLWNLTTAIRTIVLPLMPLTLLVFAPDQVAPELPAAYPGAYNRPNPVPSVAQRPLVFPHVAALHCGWLGAGHRHLGLQLGKGHVLGTVAQP